MVIQGYLYRMHITSKNAMPHCYYFYGRGDVYRPRATSRWRSDRYELRAGEAGDLYMQQNGLLAVQLHPSHLHTGRIYPQVECRPTNLQRSVPLINRGERELSTPLLLTTAKSNLKTLEKYFKSKHC